MVVKPLPENGRHLDFTGAVGRKFQLSQKLIPEKVRPGDLVTAEYRLDYDGWFPSNTVRVGNYVQEYKHGQEIILAEGDEICPTSTTIILR